MKVLFLDIDGPLISARAGLLPNQTAPYWHVFDQCAVALINDICKFDDRKIVVHSSWVKHTALYAFDLMEHLIGQGLKTEYFHGDPLCKPISWRYDRVAEWLGRHSEVEDYVIVDDEKPQTLDPAWLNKHLVLVDYDNGLSWNDFMAIKYGDWRK